jgi:hypothetical protein
LLAEARQGGLRVVLLEQGSVEEVASRIMHEVTKICVSK